MVKGALIIMRLLSIKSFVQGELKLIIEIICKIILPYRMIIIIGMIRFLPFKYKKYKHTQR
jgi:hypothetical protein